MGSVHFAEVNVGFGIIEETTSAENKQIQLL
jgi:hypothetical protein